MIRILLVNPNGSEATTAAMAAIAEATAPGVALATFTNHGAPATIVDEAGLSAAEALLASRLDDPAFAHADAILLAAFADPCLEALRARQAAAGLSRPVTGIAEAGMAAGAENARRFAVVTTTPGLAQSIDRLAARYGHARAFAGTFLTPGDPLALMADPERLSEALLLACREAARAGAEALVIGGGPLAVAARAIAPLAPAPLIEPLVEAMRLTLRRLQATGRSRSPGPSQPP